MKTRKISVTVIPNENVLNVPVFYAESETKHHSELLKEFCYQAGIDHLRFFEIYGGLVEMGNILILTIDKESAITWMPENISKKQYNILKSLKDFYLSFSSLEFSTIISNKFNICSERKEETPLRIEEFYEKLSEFSLKDKILKYIRKLKRN